MGGGIERWIVYDPNVIGNDAAREFAFAHELAHLFNDDPVSSISWTKEQELQADYYGARYLTSLGWSIERLLGALNDLKLPNEGTQGYPSLDERRAKVRKGYDDEPSRRDSAVQTPFRVATSAVSPPPASHLIDFETLRKVQARDPELGLMFNVAAEEGNLVDPNSRQNYENELLDSLVAVRPRKTGSIAGLVSPSNVVGSSVSSDGTLLAACMSPPRLVVVDLQKITKVGDFELRVPEAIERGLDSCDISISGDNRFAALTLRAYSGERLLLAQSLSGAKAPEVALSNFDQAVFVGKALAVAKGTGFRLVSTENWTEETSIQTTSPIRRLLSEPSSSILSTISDAGVTMYHINYAPLKATLMVFAPLLSLCAPTSDSLYCGDADAWFSRLGQRNGQKDPRAVCQAGCVFLPSAARSTVPGWALMFVSTADRTLRFTSPDIRYIGSMQLPEQILTGRLLEDGEVVVIGGEGGVYRFNSMRYADCCTVTLAHSAKILGVAAGLGGMTAVLVEENSNGILEIFRGKDLVSQLSISDPSSVREMLWATDHSVAVAHETQVQLVDLGQGAKRPVVSRTLSCGTPIAFDESGARIACAVDDGRKIQLRDVGTSNTLGEFVGHNAPLQGLVVRGGSLIAGGVYPSRNQTQITEWNINNSDVTQKTCPFTGPAGPKPFTFVDEGRSFLQLDTPRMVKQRDSRTCEELWSRDTPANLVHLKSIGAMAAVLEEDFNSLFVGSPLPTALRRGVPAVNTYAPIENFSISPDGDIVVQTAGRVVRLPVTAEGILEEAKKRISREFTAAECQEFFPAVPCPKMLLGRQAR